MNINRRTIFTALTVSLVLCINLTVYAETVSQSQNGYKVEAENGNGLNISDISLSDVQNHLKEAGIGRDDGKQAVITNGEAGLDSSGRWELSHEGTVTNSQQKVVYEDEVTTNMKFPSEGGTEEETKETPIPPIVINGVTIVSGTISETTDPTETGEETTPSPTDPEPSPDRTSLDPTQSASDIGETNSKLTDEETDADIYDPKGGEETTAPERYAIISQYSIIIEGGKEVEVLIVQYPSGITEVLQTFPKEEEEITDIEEVDESWTLDYKVLDYGIWYCKNLTNSDWKKYHGDKYYLLNDTVQASKTKGKTSIHFSFGKGMFDDGTWSIVCIPFYDHHYYKWVNKEVSTYNNITKQFDIDYVPEKKELTIEDVEHEAIYYEVTVPLICSTCPEITICLGDDAGCDCGDLNTKCDDELEPEIVIEHRSELTN